MCVCVSHGKIHSFFLYMYVALSAYKCVFGTDAVMHTHTSHSTHFFFFFFVTASRMTGAEISDVKLMYAVLQYLFKI